MLEINVEISAIFLKSAGFFNNGIKKYRYANPLNVNILVTPIRNVSLKPNPSIGKILCGTKSLATENNIIIMLIKTIGISIKFTLEIGLIPSLSANTTGIKKRSNRKVMGLFSKYINFKLFVRYLKITADIKIKNSI
jgi:hypothetical protein